MNGLAPNPVVSHPAPTSGRTPLRLLRAAFALVIVFGLIGCSVFQTGVSALPEGALETQIAAEVTRISAVTAPPSPGDQPTAAQPTYTPLPTYTPYPTFTMFPTYTPVPSFTPPVVNIPVETSALPSQTPLAIGGAGHPYTLRVRNMFRSTYWIGTYMPYGGNFIKPYWYVEFYPPQPTEMRIFFCRYTSYFYNHWQDIDFEFDYDAFENDDVDIDGRWAGCGRWDYLDFWYDRGGLYNCNFLDFYVDQPLLEVQVP